MPFGNLTQMVGAETCPNAKIAGSEANRKVLFAVTLDQEERTFAENRPANPMPVNIPVPAFPRPSAGNLHPYPSAPSAIDNFRVEPNMAGRGGLYQTTVENM